MALALRTPASNDNKTYAVCPYELSVRQAGSYTRAVTYEANSTWILDTDRDDVPSIIGRFADRLGLHAHTPRICRKFSPGTLSDEKISDDIVLVREIAPYLSGVQLVTYDTIKAQAEQASRYPIADFIRPIEYSWNENF